jgi:hypothetical protein
VRRSRRPELLSALQPPPKRDVAKPWRRRFTNGSWPFASWTPGFRMPTVTQLDHERLKAALEQRAKEWKRELRAEPRIARLLLRRLVGPIVLFDGSERPAFVKWEAQPTVGLLDGF